MGREFRIGFECLQLLPIDLCSRIELVGKSRTGPTCAEVPNRTQRHVRGKMENLGRQKDASLRTAILYLMHAGKPTNFSNGHMNTRRY